MASIPFSDVLDWQPLPVDAQDVVTKVRLVVSGDLAGAAPDSVSVQNRAGEQLAYFPQPVIVEYEAPEHAIYGAERSFALPTGFNPFLSPTDPRIPEPIVVGFTNPGTPSVVRDGDPETFALWDGDAPAADGRRSIFYDLAAFTHADALAASRMVGFRLVWSMTGGTLLEDGGDILARAITRPPVHVFLRASPGWSGDDSDYVDARAVYAVRPIDAVTEAYGLLPGAAYRRWWETPAGMTSALVGVMLAAYERADVEQLRVHSFYPLMLDDEALLEAARAQVRLPAALPQRVTVRGVILPDRTHTLTGWPGGDFTGDVAQHQYELGRTIIDFEQAGAPVGLPAEAMEAARERGVAVAGVVRVASYDLRMGGRS